MMRVGELFGDNLSTIASYKLEAVLPDYKPVEIPPYGTLIGQLQNET